MNELGRQTTKEALLTAIKRGDLAEVERLLDRGANINAQNATRDGWTPLHWACQRGCLHIARLLLEKGADVNARDQWDRTPLDIACDTPEGNPRREEILSLFRDRFPEAYFTKFCETQGRMPGRGM